MSNMDIMSGNIKTGLVLRINVEFKRECYLNFITEYILYIHKKKVRNLKIILCLSRNRVNAMSSISLKIFIMMIY